MGRDKSSTPNSLSEAERLAVALLNIPTAGAVLTASYRDVFVQAATLLRQSVFSETNASVKAEGQSANEAAAEATHRAGIFDKKHRLDWIALVIRDICEIPYRFSPDDFPEAMVVTPEELRAFIEQRFPQSATRESVLEEAAKVCEQMRPINPPTRAVQMQRETLDNAARLIRALKQTQAE